MRRDAPGAGSLCLAAKGGASAGPGGALTTRAPKLQGAIGCPMLSAYAPKLLA